MAEEPGGVGGESVKQIYNDALTKTESEDML